MRMWKRFYFNEKKYPGEEDHEVFVDLDWIVFSFCHNVKEGWYLEVDRSDTNPYPLLFSGKVSNEFVDHFIKECKEYQEYVRKN